MKYKLLIFITLIFALILSACNSGFKKDLNTGLTTTWKDLSVEDAYLMDLNTNQKLSSNEIAMGTQIAVVVSGVSNLTEVEGKVAPSIDITITDETGKTALEGKDLLKEEFKKEEATQLDATLTVGNPLESGKKYHMKARFYDKKGKGEIISELDLVIK